MEKRKTEEYHTKHDRYVEGELILNELLNMLSSQEDRQQLHAETELQRGKPGYAREYINELQQRSPLTDEMEDATKEYEETGNPFPLIFILIDQMEAQAKIFGINTFVEVDKKLEHDQAKREKIFQEKLKKLKNEAKTAKHEVNKQE